MSIGSSVITNALTDLAAIAAKASSRSDASRAAKSERSILSDRAVNLMAARTGWAAGFAGLNTTPARTRPGNASLSNSTRFAASSRRKYDVPVTLLPGRARLDTRPTATASPTDAKTMGIVAVAPLAAETPAVEYVTMTSI